MLVVEVPSMRPFVCVDGTQGVSIDTLCQIPVYGRIYISKHQLRSMVGLFPGEWVEQDQHDEVVETLALANDRILELEAELVDLVPVRDAIVSATARYGDLELDDEPVRPTARARKAA